MRLHRLHLRDVKGVAERTVEFPDTGVVVIEGPNEIGKTTLLEAFDLLLDPKARATSQSRAVKALKPVDRDVGPRVEAEFTVGAHRLRFAKQWLRGAATELEILTPVREQHTGEAAQHRLESILAESLDRPLWDALRFTQAGELGQVALTDSSVLTQALDGASGVDLHSADSAPLLDRVESEFLRYYTPTGRVGGELKTALAAASAARDEAVQAHGALIETEELLGRHERLRAQAADLAARQAALVERLERAQAHDREVTAVLAAHEASTAALVRARQDAVRARDDLTRRERAEADLVDAQTRVEAAQDAVAADRDVLAAAEDSGAALVQALDAAREDRVAARDVADLAAADVEHLTSLERAQRLRDLLLRLQDLKDQDVAARELLAGAPEVDPALVRELETLERELFSLQAALDAGGQVVIEALGASTSVVVEGETIDLSEASGQAHQVPVRGGVSIEFPGEFRVSVRPEQGATERAAALAQAAGRRAELLQRAGVSDLESAREAAAHRASIQAKLRHLAERTRDALGGQTLEQVTSEIQALTASLAASAQRPADAPLPASASTARAVAKAAVARLRTAEATLERAQEEARGHERRLAQVRLRVEKAGGVIESLTQRLEQDHVRLEESRAARTDEALREAVATASATYAQVEAQAAVTGRELEEADVQGVRARLEQAQRALAEHTARETRVSREQAEVQGQVEMVSGEGRREAYDLAVAEFLRLKGELDTVHRRARAARQLWETLGRHREAAHRAYVRPYQEEIQRLGRVVYGASFDVEVGEDLTIRGRTLEGLSVPFEQLSGGAKEQLGILSRLAVAGLVEAGDGVPVIIDDALGYTDPERLARVSAVFAGPGERTQVVLLTCTPERYREIPGATTIQLTA